MPQEFTLLALFGPLMVAVGIVLVVRPQILLVLTVIYIPLEQSTFFDSILPSSLTVPKLLGFLLLGAVLFNIIFRKERFRLFDDIQDFAVVLFCAAVSLSSLNTMFPGQVISEIDRIFRLMTFYFATKNLVKDPKMMHALMMGLFITSVYASAFGIHEYNTTTTVWGDSIRASGINNNPNNFSMASVIATAIGVYFLRASQRNFTKLLYAAGTTTILVGILLSGSRGGLISLSVMFGLMILRHPKRIQFLLAAVCIVVISIPFWPENIRERYLPSNASFKSSYEQAADFSVERRGGYLDFGITLVADQPLFGSGYRTFEMLYPRSDFARFDNPLSDHETYRVAHSIYLETAVGTGAFGLCTLLAMLFITWRASHQAGKHLEPGSTPWATARALEYGAIAFAVSSISISSDQSKYLWFLLGMSSAILYYARHSGYAAPTIVTSLSGKKTEIWHVPNLWLRKLGKTILPTSHID